jgi:hypothetical protein
LYPLQLYLNRSCHIYGMVWYDSYWARLIEIESILKHLIVLNHLYHYIRWHTISSLYHEYLHFCGFGEQAKKKKTTGAGGNKGTKPPPSSGGGRRNGGDDTPESEALLQLLIRQQQRAQSLVHALCGQKSYWHQTADSFFKRSIQLKVLTFIITAFTTSIASMWLI